MDNSRPTGPGPGGLIPRFGMYAGPNYGGGQKWAPGQRPSEAAWQVPPISYLDEVTRSHDINYTYIEQTYRHADAASHIQARWQADKEMLAHLLRYRPDNWLERQYRSAAIQAFVAKADMSYRPHVDVVDEWNRDLAGIDARFPTLRTTPEGRAQWNTPKLLHTGATYATTGMEALSTSGVNLQVALLFNTHIRPHHIDPLRSAHGSGEVYEPWAGEDFSRRILVPQRDSLERRVFTAEGHIDGRRVVIRYDSANHLLTRASYKGEQLESLLTYTGKPAPGQAGERYGFADFTVTRQQYAHGEPVGEPEILPPVRADEPPMLKDSLHTRAVAGIVTQGERAIYPTQPTEADKAWHTGGYRTSHADELGRGPLSTASHLSGAAHQLLRDSHAHVQRLCQQQGLTWDPGMDNTAGAMACTAHAHGWDRITHAKAQGGRIHMASHNSMGLREAFLDAREAANTPLQQSLDQMVHQDHLVPSPPSTEVQFNRNSRWDQAHRMAH